MSCNEYFLVTLESKSTPVRHKYTNLTDEWYGPDGVKYEDSDMIAKIEEQATDKNRIGDNTLYQKLIEIHSQGESIKSDIGSGLYEHGPPARMIGESSPRSVRRSGIPARSSILSTVE